MNGRNAMRPLAGFAVTSAVLIVVPVAVLAAPIQMTPNPLGDWIAPSLVAASVSLQSGDTQPVPTVVLRSAVDGTELAPSTVNFDFQFDADIVSASVSSQSGNITIGPFLSTAGNAGFRRLSFVCGQTVNPCSVDVTFELVSAPTTLDVTDANDYFSDSPGAPNQVLSSTFSSNAVPALPALSPPALVAAATALLLTGGWARRHSPRRKSGEHGDNTLCRA